MENRPYNKAVIIGNEIVKSNRPAVALLFSRYGINAPPSGESLFWAMIKNKKPFVNDMYNLISYSGFVPLDIYDPEVVPANTGTGQGSGAATTGTTGTVKTPSKKGFFEFLNNITSTASGIVDVLNKTKEDGSTPGGTETGKKGDSTGNNNKLMLIGFSVIAILILLLIILKRK